MEERRRIKSEICRKYAGSITSCGENWRELAVLADQTFDDAIQALEQKRYRLFQIRLTLYSDIWQYASSHLSAKDYQYFCLCQVAPRKEYVM